MESPLLACANSQCCDGVCQVNLLNSEGSDDITILSARSLTFLADVLPSSAASIVRNGAVPALCARLLAVEDIDLAEQSLQVRNLSLMFKKQTQTSCGHYPFDRHTTLLVSALKTVFQPKLCRCTIVANGSVRSGLRAYSCSLICSMNGHLQEVSSRVECLFYLLRLVEAVHR